MTSLIILATVLLAVWVWALVERDGRAASIRTWLHVPFVGAITCYLMAIGLWVT
jgi:hypothetical protein